MFTYVTARASSNPNIRQHASFGPLTVLLRSGDNEFLLTIDETGASLGVPAVTQTPDLTLTASPEAWAELRKPDAQPGFQTLSAMRRTQNLIVTGDMVMFQQHLMLLELLFANLTDEKPSPSAVTIEPTFEPITGRYVRLTLEDRSHRIFFEEAGPTSGIPLVCLHTAGSDSRQYRHILNDTAITDRFRVIVALQAPVDHILEVRYGAWSAATQSLLTTSRMGSSIQGRADPPRSSRP